MNEMLWDHGIVCILIDLIMLRLCGFGAALSGECPVF